MPYLIGDLPFWNLSFKITATDTSPSLVDEQLQQLPSWAIIRAHTFGEEELREILRRYECKDAGEFCDVGRAVAFVKRRTVRTV